MMLTDRELGRAISGWLEAEAPPRIPDRSLRATFERTRRTRQERRIAALLRRVQMQRPTVVIGTAAAVLALVVGFQFLGRPSSASLASPSPVASATAGPSPVTPLPSRGDGSLPVGSFVLSNTGVRMTVTVPSSGWFGQPGGGSIVREGADPPTGAGMIVFSEPQYFVYGDPCAWSGSKPAAPVTTVDAMIAALQAQKSRDAGTPTDATVGGYAAKSIVLHVPKDLAYTGRSFTSCNQGLFGSWSVSGTEPDRYHQGPGQIDKVWVLSVGDRLVLVDISYYDGTQPAAVADLESIVASMTFE
jgi:hypothetical protein